MRIIQRSIAAGLALASALLIAGGCNSLIGATKPTLVDSLDAGDGGTVVEAGPSCLHNSDCKDAQVCLFRVCSQACAADKDCQLTQRCLSTTAGTACVIATSASCASGGGCPDGSQCKAGACRTACQSAGDCLTDQVCVGGVCVGTDEGHDPGPSGGSAGSGGGGGDAGMAGSGSAMGGSDQTMGGSDQTSAGSGGSGGSTTTPECAPDYAACKGLSPVSCQNGKILSAGPDCPFACKSGACTGECVTGNTQCAGQVFSQCDATNTWQTSTCKSVCDATKGCVGTCTLGSLQCNGSTELDVCTAGAYVKQTACPVACAIVSNVSKCVACGDHDGICPNGCTSPTDPDCPKSVGEKCTSGSDCANGFCVNTVCCGTSSCSGNCFSCDVSGHEGTCTEVNGSPNSDPDNCGGCGTVCSQSNITRSCSGGVCGGTCALGFSDCDGNKGSNGCEIHTDADTAHCGGCTNKVCSTNNIGVNSCNGGICNGSCVAGYADCNSDKLTDGCEIHTASDPNNCGTCNKICPYLECSNSSCAASVHSGLIGPGSGETDAFAGRIYLFKVTFASAGKLAALGMYTTTANAHAYLGLYSDLGGVPQGRVATTSELTTVANNQTEGVLSALVSVSATSYWIALNTDAAVSTPLHVGCETGSSSAWSAAATYAPLPATAPSATSGTLQTPDFYAVTVP